MTGCTLTQNERTKFSLFTQVNQDCEDEHNFVI